LNQLSFSMSTHAIEQKADYCLRYCYRYEPGFPVYSIWDIVLYKEAQDEQELQDPTGEIYRFLKKEEHYEEKEEEQVFFKNISFKYNPDVSYIDFLKVVLFPSSLKDDSVVNLVFIPLEKPWDKHTSFEQIAIIDKIIKEQEEFVGISYKLVKYYTEEIFVDNHEDNESFSDISDDDIEVLEE
jgi:hypothetical protein